MSVLTSTSENQIASNITYVTADEAYHLLLTELNRFITVVETLEPGDWQKNTACSGWNVRDILAHQAGGYVSGTGYKELVRQIKNKPKPGQLPEDAINEFQLKERKDKTPQELMKELRAAGPIAAKKWAYQFRLIKPIAIPHAVTGKLSLRHLMWVIHSRDTWMHRLDICRATGSAFEQTTEHDGRIAALVMRDVADLFTRKQIDYSLVFDLSGVAGGYWKIGEGDPAAVIRMDVLDFNIFVSGRYTFETARPLMVISGDINRAEDVLKQILVLY